MGPTACSARNCCTIAEAGSRAPRRPQRPQQPLDPLRAAFRLPHRVGRPAAHDAVTVAEHQPVQPRFKVLQQPREPLRLDPLQVLHEFNAEVEVVGVALLHG